MTRSTDKKAAECHVLDFFYDDEGGCALTVFANGVRFHVVADPARLTADSRAGKAIECRYKSLISALRNEVEDENDEGVKKRQELDAAEIHDLENEGDDSQDSGRGPSDDDAENAEVSDNDSAVDLRENRQELNEIGVRDSGVVLGERYAPKPEKSLHHWMLSPFGHTFQEKTSTAGRPKNPTLHDWYHGPAYLFNLEIENGNLSWSEDTSSEPKTRMQKLIPNMPLPRYIKKLGIAMVQAKDITVVEEGTEPEPYHPTRVKVGDEVQFLKVIDMSQHQPTKREISILKEIEKKGLHEKFHVPRVLGLAYDTSKSEIMGFLQTDIEDPTPLTKMLDSDVVEDNRRKWADESERIVKLLHDNKIIWGDAKADNFVVDKHGELWIIDFGGSYTDGWVDPELMETQEGDDMGTEKIVNALRDPEANTYNPDQEESDEDDEDETRQVSTPPSQSGRKRERDTDDEDDDDDADKSTTKRRK